MENGGLSKKMQKCSKIKLKKESYNSLVWISDLEPSMALLYRILNEFKICISIHFLSRLFGSRGSPNSTCLCCAFSSLCSISYLNFGITDLMCSVSSLIDN